MNWFSMTLKLPQRCFATDVEEADDAVLAAGGEQAPIVPVRGTVRGVPEARERLDGLLGVPAIDVDPRGCCDSIVIWRDWGEVNFIYCTEFLYLNRCLVSPPVERVLRDPLPELGACLHHHRLVGGHGARGRGGWGSAAEAREGPTGSR